MVFDKKEWGKKYREKNKEHRKEYDKQYYQNNKEHLKEYQIQYRQENKEQIKEFKKQYNKTPAGKKNQTIKKRKKRALKEQG